MIKRLRAVDAGPVEADRLAAERRILAALDHPHLARVYDLDMSDGRPFVVMESVRGRNLADVRRHVRVGLADAARWVAAVARAADYAHARGVLHLGIKPRNVILDGAGRAVLIDFGLARVDRGLDPPGHRGRGERDALVYGPRAGPGRARPGRPAGRRVRAGRGSLLPAGRQGPGDR